MFAFRLRGRNSQNIYENIKKGGGLTIIVLFVIDFALSYVDGSVTISKVNIFDT